MKPEPPREVRIGVPTGLAGTFPEDELYNVAENMKDTGIDLPEDGWAFYNKTTSQLIALMPGTELDLLERAAGVSGW